MANFVSNDNATSLMNAINQKKDSKPSTITWAEWIALTDEQREGTHYIITNVPAKFSDKDAVFSIKDETLEFTNKTATVTDSRITADTYIFTFYHNQAMAQAAGIECSWTTGTVIFTVDENPSEDIVVDILCIIPALATPKEDITAEDVSYDSTKNVKQKIDEVNSEKVNISDIANNLSTTAAGKVLDARQGKVLNESMVKRNAIDWGTSISFPVRSGNSHAILFSWQSIMHVLYNGSGVVALDNIVGNDNSNFTSSISSGVITLTRNSATALTIYY